MKKTELTNNQLIAREILNQLGGNRFLSFTGSKNLCAIENGLQMHLTRNKAKAKYLTITLNSSDTYDMVFKTDVRKKNEAMSQLLGKAYYQTTGFKVVAEFKGAYNDMLQSIFTDITGLYTKF